ncbi:MAG: NAD(P)/FAD-dependent oxidoreductase [Sphingomonadaceae bacterium]
MSEHAPSYYAATANPAPRHPALQGAVDADVVVVGGGFTGLSAALSAAEAGYSVVLLEAKRIGWGASGRNGGQMIPGMRWSATDLLAEFGEERARALIALGQEAGARVRARIARHGIACDLRDGHFHAAWKPAHLDTIKHDCEVLERLGAADSLQVVERADVPSYVASEAYHGGLHDPAGGHLHPLNYALGLADAAQAAGVRIFEDSPATAMDHGAPVRVTTPHGTISARMGVLACDSDVGQLEPTFRSAMMPIANYNVATVPLGEDTARALIPSNASIAESRFVLNYYRLTADHRLLFGGGEKYTPAPPASIADFVRPFMEQIFPQLRGVQIDYGWGGMVGVTLNRLPQFGRIGNTFYAHGYSGHGVLLTTLAGELIVEAMRGTAERFDLMAELPRQRFPGGKLLRHPLHVAGMLWYALKDRL